MDNVILEVEISNMLDDRLGIITEYGHIRRLDGQLLPTFQSEQGQEMEVRI